MQTVDVEAQVIATQYTPIAGAGGGGGKGSKGKNSRKPKESPDTLESSSQVNVLYLLGEGEVQGTGNIYQSVFLDDTPIQNMDGSFNYENVKLFFRPGSLTQDYIPGFSSEENEETVGNQLIKRQGSLTRTITNGDANAVRIRVMVPALQKIDSKTGDIKPTSVSFKIEIAVVGAGFVERVRDTISGKTTSPYERFYRVDLPPSNSGQWLVRLTRLTDDSESQKLQNDLFWQSYTTIIDAKLRYPNSVLLGMRLDGEQFNSLPRVSIRLKWKKILVPVNYDQNTRTYHGTWNGIFKHVYCNNPAWVLYDMMINTRYGAGKWLDTGLIDKWGLYSIAQYCDQLVPDGKGGSEPRFTFNGALTEESDAYELLSRIAASFRASLIWTGGTIEVKQDKPVDVATSKIFTRANVLQDFDEDGGASTPTFNYSSSGKAARHTLAYVNYNNPDNYFQPDQEYYENFDALSRYGFNPITLDLLGCTSQGQARRHGKWTILSEQLLTKTITFRAGLQGANLSILDLIQVSDPLRTQSRQGGRVVNIFPNSYILLDSQWQTTVIHPGYTIKFQAYPGFIHTATITEVHHNWDNTGLIRIRTNDAAQPFVGAIWVVENPALQLQKFRILSAVDRTDDKEKPHYELTCLQYNQSLFNAVDFGTEIEVPPTAVRPPNIPNKPFNLAVEVSPLLRENSWRFSLKVSWERPLFMGVDDPYTASYQIQYKHGVHGQYMGSVDSPSTYLEYPEMVEDIYFVRVRAKDIFNRFSPWLESVQVICKRPVPANPIGTIRKQLGVDNGVYLSWSDTQSYSYGIIGYRVYIRKGEFGTKSLFQYIPLGTYYTNPFNLPPDVYYVTIHPVDRTGQESEKGLEVILGSEFAPPNPSATVTVSVDDFNNIQLFWENDTTVYPPSFTGYSVYRIKPNQPAERIFLTPNQFTSVFLHDDAVGAEYRIKSRNTKGYESIGYLTMDFPKDSLLYTVPVPLGQITKSEASDGGIILRWTDTQLYDTKKFAGYKIYINNKLVGESAVTEMYSIQFSNTENYQVLIKAYYRSGLQSFRGLQTTIYGSELNPPAPNKMLVQQTLQGTKQFFWKLPEVLPPDLKLYRLKFVTGNSLDWNKGHFLKDIMAETTSFETNLFREGIYTIMVKTVDVKGYESEGLSFTTINLGDPIETNLVESFNFGKPELSFPMQTNPKWQAEGYVHNNMVTTLDTVTGINSLKVVNNTQEAWFECPFEPTQEGHLRVKIKARGNYRVELRKESSSLMWVLFNEDNPYWQQVNEGSPFWTSTDPFVLAPVETKVDLQGYRIRVTFSASPSDSFLTELIAFVDSPDIVTSHPDVFISSAANGIRVKPSKPMKVLKTVSLALQDFGTGARSLQVIGAKDPVQGVLIKAFDAAGNPVTALFDCVLVGF